MPVPRLIVPKTKISETELKLSKLESILNNMGYICDGSKDVVRIIEQYSLDKTQFDFPFGSFDVFKEKVLDGFFDEDFTSRCLTKEQSDKLQQDISEGKIWVTY